MNRVRLFNLFLFSMFIIFSLFVFRIREYGSDSVDFQIVLRLMAWGGGILIAFIYFYKLYSQLYTFWFSAKNKLVLSFSRILKKLF